jgi:hypothetical protein
MKQLLLRGTAGAIVIVIFITAGAAVASAIRSKSPVSGDSTTPRTDSVTQAATPVIDSAASATVVPAAVAPPTTPTPTPTVAPAVEAPKPAPAAAPFVPAIPLGESPLAPDVVATRSDSDVVVAFDKPMTRTRRPEKFEAFVRSTLPTIYGAAATSALGKIPEGGLVAQGNLLTELPSRGVRVPVDGSWMLRVFPETRPGQDGPLVVRYRVRVVPIGG